MMIRMFLAAVISAAFIACSNNKTVVVDNPQGIPVTFKIDKDSVYKLDSFQTMYLSLPAGAHELEVDGKKESFQVSADSSLLNPTKSVYILREQLYTNITFNINNDKISEILLSRLAKLPQDTVMIAGFPLSGHLKSDSSILITKIWDYSLTEKFPMEIRIEGEGNTRIKISRRKDFIAELLEEMFNTQQEDSIQ